ncbi:MAG TPA: hypothetical protein ENN05_02415 [Deltaproteobacteria bacterium]|nr:hypothetical protein [Deltaproteobacteria bacterium]
MRLEGYRCGGITITGDIHAESRDVWPVVHNRFEIDTNLGIYQVVICGVVDDARREICGSWQIHSAGTICSGEWKSDLQEELVHTY